MGKEKQNRDIFVKKKKKTFPTVGQAAAASFLSFPFFSFQFSIFDLRSSCSLLPHPCFILFRVSLPSSATKRSPEREKEKGKQKIFAPPNKIYRKSNRAKWTDYLLAKQHIIPVRPRNQHAPVKRMRESAAVAHRRAWKKCVVRLVARDWIVGRTR